MQYTVQDRTKFVEMFGFKILSWMYFIYLAVQKDFLPPIPDCYSVMHAVSWFVIITTKWYYWPDIIVPLTLALDVIWATIFQMDIISDHNWTWNKNCAQ